MLVTTGDGTWNHASDRTGPHEPEGSIRDRRAMSDRPCLFREIGFKPLPSVLISRSAGVQDQARSGDSDHQSSCLDRVLMDVGEVLEEKIGSIMGSSPTRATGALSRTRVEGVRGVDISAPTRLLRPSERRLFKFHPAAVSGTRRTISPPPRIRPMPSPPAPDPEDLAASWRRRLTLRGIPADDLDEHQLRWAMLRRWVRWRPTFPGGGGPDVWHYLSQRSWTTGCLISTLDRDLSPRDLPARGAVCPDCLREWAANLARQRGGG
jgi:hypothetical protein